MLPFSLGKQIRLALSHRTTALSDGFREILGRNGMEWRRRRDEMGSFFHNKSLPHCGRDYLMKGIRPKSEMNVLWSSTDDFRSNIVVPRYPMIETLLSAGPYMLWLPLLGRSMRRSRDFIWLKMKYSVNNNKCASFIFLLWCLLMFLCWSRYGK